MNTNSIGKVVCVGRNYAAHAQELGNAIPTQPLLFIKPASCVVGMNTPIPAYQQGEAVHYEAELCVQLGQPLSVANAQTAKVAISGVTLGLDLTLRAQQSRLKQAGQPWERAKCFDGACVLGDWIAPDVFADLQNVRYELLINDERRQQGDTTLMLFPLYTLLAQISTAFSLQAGDVVMTGTPSGVGALQKGDQLQLRLGDQRWQTQVK